MRLVPFVLVLAMAAHLSAADTADDLLNQAKQAMKDGKTTDALALAGKAAALAPKDPAPLFFRGTVYARLGKHDEAIADFNAVLAIEPKAAEAYQHRGSEQFRRGKIAESLADFDKFLEFKPDQRPGHWQRGISLYYVGRFEDGKKQFESYEKVDTNDVENAVWQFLCNARLVGVDKARGQLLKIGKDTRVPMMQVYDLFAGKLEPDDVLKAARAGEPAAKELNTRLFYTYLYLGLYAEAKGDKKKTLEYMTEADAKRTPGEYMGDVAHVHLELRRKEMKEQGGK